MFRATPSYLYQKFLHIFIIIFIFLYVINFLTANSFLVPAKMEGDDSCVFVTFGFAWLNGLIPYRDIFDNKGPVLWLLNMWGFSFFNNEVGVFGIEIIVCLLWVGIIIILLRKNIFFAALSILILFELLLSSTFEGGNYTEEYSILFNMISILLYFSKIKKLYFKYMMYGLMGGLCFYLRPNVAAPTLAICILECAKNFHWKYIFKLGIFSLLGFMLVAIPFSIYFYMENSLYKFYESILLGNITYTVQSASQWYGKFVNFILGYALWGIIISLLLILLFYMKKFIFFKESLFINLFSFILGIISLRTYPHYLMIMAVPYIFICKIFTMIPKYEYLLCYDRLTLALKSKNLTKEKVLFTACLMGMLFYYAHYSLQLHYNMFSSAKKEAYEEYFSNIGLSSNSKILNLGTHKDTSIFYYLHVLPQERSFFPQIIQPKGEEYDIYKNIDKILKSNKYDVVLLPSHVDIDLKKYGFNPVGKFKDSLIFKKN